MKRSDNGTPLTATEPDGPHAKIYRDIATKVWEQVAAGKADGKTAPAIVFE